MTSRVLDRLADVNVAVEGQVQRRGVEVDDIGRTVLGVEVRVNAPHEGRLAGACDVSLLARAVEQSAWLLEVLPAMPTQTMTVGRSALGGAVDSDVDAMAAGERTRVGGTRSRWDAGAGGSSGRFGKIPVSRAPLEGHFLACTRYWYLHRLTHLGNRGVWQKSKKIRR